MCPCLVCHTCHVEGSQKESCNLLLPSLSQVLLRNIFDTQFQDLSHIVLKPQECNQTALLPPVHLLCLLGSPHARAHQVCRAQALGGVGAGQRVLRLLSRLRPRQRAPRHQRPAPKPSTQGTWSWHQVCYLDSFRKRNKSITSTSPPAWLCQKLNHWVEGTP